MMMKMGDRVMNDQEMYQCQVTFHEFHRAIVELYQKIREGQHPGYWMVMNMRALES